MLGNMKSDVGILSVVFDPKDKYYKPAGFGGKMKAHHEYIEEGRRPWNYRAAGSAMVMPDSVMGYPRVCAHRGFSKVAPENSMPAFGAAIALGAQEIEFDLWPTKDGEVVSCHDSTLERVSTGEGKVYEHTLEELSALDFGVKFSESFKGLGVVTFEAILKKFACQTVMNIHIKPLPNVTEYPETVMEKIVALIRKYDCEKHVYFMLSEDSYIRQFKQYAPDIPVCVGHHPSRPWDIVDRAIELGAQKVQLFGQYYNQDMIDKAHEHGILCNLFYADDIEKAIAVLDMGVDTILTNDYLKISNAVKEHLTKK
jgi:glycerophosphoryl diester phosphodiesterase